MGLDLGPWAAMRHLFATAGRRLVAGISGGSTSALMAALMDADAVLSFQNTGREARRTYEFLQEVGDAIERPIVWLEYRPPKEHGGRPFEARFDIVTPQSADKRGGPFEMMMDALNAFRAKNGKGPIAPWWRSRICSAYLKQRTARKHVQALGWGKWVEAAGLRADEPRRIAQLNGRGQPSYVHRIAPLHAAGIDKSHVEQFWASQSFRLGLPEHMGNCTGCFLKDQADLSRAMNQEESDCDWWEGMTQRWPMFGGRDFYGYAKLKAEAADRERIEAALRDGARSLSEIAKAAPSERMGSERYRLVVIQERKRFLKQVQPVSCGCEGSDSLSGGDDEQEEQLILNLPEAA